MQSSDSHGLHEFHASPNAARAKVLLLADWLSTHSNVAEQSMDRRFRVDAMRQLSSLKEACLLKYTHPSRILSLNFLSNPYSDEENKMEANLDWEA